MTAQDINGKDIAAAIREEIREEVATMKSPPGLAVILVGSRRDSQAYVTMKTKACAQAGIQSFQFNFDASVEQEELLKKIEELNLDEQVHGILIQLPLPDHLDESTILQAVQPDKDVDGLHPVNVAKLALLDKFDFEDASNRPFSIPCTPLGCMELLYRSHVPIRGQHAVVLGRSQLVGWPMVRLLTCADATVTLVHSKTQNIASVTQQGDIVVAAVGQAGLVTQDWVKEGAVVIDVGINSVDIEPKKPGGKAYKLVGDVDYDQCRHVASKITPVPGGVGPMTIAMLLRNTLQACQRSQQQ